jgi:hypothetical protein
MIIIIQHNTFVAQIVASGNSKHICDKCVGVWYTGIRVVCVCVWCIGLWDGVYDWVLSPRCHFVEMLGMSGSTCVFNRRLWCWGDMEMWVWQSALEIFKGRYKVFIEVQYWAMPYRWFNGVGSQYLYTNIRHGNFFLQGLRQEVM